MPQETLAQAQERADAAEKALEAFKKKVHQVALTTKDEEDWCDDGFNSAMMELGLPLCPNGYRIQGTIEIDAFYSDAGESASGALSLLVEALSRGAEYIDSAFRVDTIGWVGTPSAQFLHDTDYA